LLSEVLVFLSAISAIAIAIANLSTTRRFAVGFLGLFSSLMVYLRTENALGMILLVTSSIALPTVLASRVGSIDKRPGEPIRLQMPVTMLYPIAALVIGLIMRFELVDTGLAVLASIGLAMFTAIGHPPKPTLGLTVLSQAVLVAVSLRDLPLWLMLLSESCRLLCIAYVSTRGGLPPVQQ